MRLKVAPHATPRPELTLQTRVQQQASGDVYNVPEALRLVRFSKHRHTLCDVVACDHYFVVFGFRSKRPPDFAA